jgi:GNAT superfamily N-acetyltransferase
LVGHCFLPLISLSGYGRLTIIRLNFRVNQDASTMIEIEHELRSPANNEEWQAFHDIRRKVLFENRGKVEPYIENHPDDSKPGNYPLVLLYKGKVIGAMRIDISGTSAWLRRVAIREDLQRLGHGRVLVRLAERFARAKGCTEARCNAAVEAIGFYERCGYLTDASTLAPSNSVSMLKLL